MKPQMIDCIKDIDSKHLTGKLSEIKNRLDAWIAQYGENAIMELYSPDWIEAGIRYIRLETEEEVNKRLLREKKEKERKQKSKIQQREREKKLYEKLKKKYG